MDNSVENLIGFFNFNNSSEILSVLPIILG